MKRQKKSSIESERKVVIEIDLDKVSKQKQNLVPVATENNSAVKVTIGEDKEHEAQPKE